MDSVVIFALALNGIIATLTLVFVFDLWKRPGEGGGDPPSTKPSPFSKASKPYRGKIKPVWNSETKELLKEKESWSNGKPPHLRNP